MKLSYLYTFGKNCNLDYCNSINTDYKYDIFHPGLFKWKLGKFTSIKDLLIHFFWFVVTLGKYRILYITDKGNVVHSSYIFPKMIKLHYMEKGGLEIGPCKTNADYRGQGIYPSAITYIIQQLQNEAELFYMCTDVDNIPSKKGIEKAGFVQAGYVKKSNLGIYKKIDNKDAERYLTDREN